MKNVGKKRISNLQSKQQETEKLSYAVQENLININTLCINNLQNTQMMLEINHILFKGKMGIRFGDG